MGIDPGIEKKFCEFFEEKAPILVFILAKDGEIIHANKFTKNAIGFDLIGKNFRDLVVDFSGEFDFNQVIQHGSQEHLINLSTASGLPQSFYFNFDEMPDSVLAFGRMDAQELAIMRKEVLTLNQELNNLTRRLHKKNAQLHRLNQEKNQFLGMAAHDLRKPIGLVITFSEFLIEEAASSLEEEHSGFLNTIHDSASYMKRLVDDFLDISAIEAGKFELDIQPARIQDALQQSLTLNRLQAEMKGVDIQVKLAGEPPALMMDSPKIEQAMTNLISNAVEHSDPGARIQIIICCEDENRTLTFSVRDWGPGIAPEKIERLFKPFSRAGAQKTGGEKSTGLGLLITRKIIQAHGGHLRVESRNGQGATFSFTLPMNETDR